VEEKGTLKVASLAESNLRLESARWQVDAGNAASGNGLNGGLVLLIKTHLKGKLGRTEVKKGQ